MYNYCQNCETGYLRYDVRDVKRTIRGVSTVIENIEGKFCDKCNEIEFDDSTDSAERYAEAGDKILSKLR